MASTYLSRTPSSAGNQQIWTLSAWIKKSKTGTANQNLFSQTGGGSTSQRMYVLFSDDLLIVSQYNGSSSDFNYTTNALFRDPSAWYHLVVSVDTTQATDSNRVKIYMNGEQITSFSSTTHPSQNLNTYVNTTQVIGIGHDTKVASRFFDGYMAEMHLTDGTAYAVSTFGATNSDGVWIPKKYSGTYGTNGFFMEFKQTGTSQNASGIGADTSGQGNHLAVTNLAATDVTTDTCTNNFATINSLANYFNPATLSEGNTRVDFDNGTSTVYNISTIGVSSGKWYCEIKAVTIPDYAEIGIASRPCIAGGNSDKLTVNQYNYGYTANNGNVKSNSSGGSSYGNTYDDGDIIGIALDLDNNKLYFSKNGTFQNSGDPTSGSTGTGAVSIQAPSGTIDGVYYFAVGDNRNGHDTRMDCNFGNPAYANSSGNTDGKYGNFEYAPPSGYYALCTKRLAEFG